MDYLKRLEQKKVSKPTYKMDRTTSMFTSNRLFLFNSVGNEYSLKYALKSLNNEINLIVDCEHFLEKGYLEDKGVNTELCLYYSPNNQCEMFEILYKLLEYKELDTIVMNSVLCLIPQTIDMKELTVKMDKLQSFVNKSNSRVFVVNPYNKTIYNNIEKYFSFIGDVSKKQIKVVKNNINFQRKPINIKEL